MFNCVHFHRYRELCLLTTCQYIGDIPSLKGGVFNYPYNPSDVLYLDREFWYPYYQQGIILTYLPVLPREVFSLLGIELTYYFQKGGILIKEKNLLFYPRDDQLTYRSIPRRGKLEESINFLRV